MPARKGGKRKLRLKGKPRGALDQMYRKRKDVGLNKVEKKQVNAIINKKAESKYMQSVYNLQGQSFKFQSSSAAENEIMVRGFAVGTGEIGGVAATYGYESIGGAARVITPMHMSRTFDATVEAATDYGAYIPDGKYVSPSMTKCTWRIFRDIIDTADTEKVRTSSQYICRFIRVMPRNLKFSDTDYTPSLDLFVNNFGLAYGVDSPPDTHTKNFGLFEMQTSKINSRKYKVIEDKTFSLDCPNISTQLNTDLIVSQAQGTHQKFLTTNHEMPKKLYYAGTYDTGDTRQPLAGQSSELIFIHIGAVGTTTKDLELDAKIDVKPIATFKDL